MKKTASKTPDLSLVVQYAIDEPDLPRWRIRRWVLGALAMADTRWAKQVSLTIRLVGKVEGRSLNQTYRKKDYATNVLTFHYDNMTGETDHIMGDVVICTPILRQEAKAQGKLFLHHAAHLVVHGTLHSLGYDHIRVDEAKAMEGLETKILARWHIDDPYAD